MPAVAKAEISPSPSLRESAWLEVLRRLRKSYPVSRYGEMSAGELDGVARQWACDLNRVPVERINDVYAATIIGAKFPPQVGEFGASWDAIAHEESTQVAGQEWRRGDAAKMAALPQGDDGPGRTASLMQQKSGLSVVCDCAPKNGYPWPAQLSPDSRYWVCVQSARCGFRLPVEAICQAGKNVVSPLEMSGGQTKREQFDTELAAGLGPGAEDDIVLGELKARCGFSPEKAGREQSLRFGHWLMGQLPLNQWTVDGGREQWKSWAERQAEAA